MRRTGKLALAAGFGAVLALAVGLVRATRSDPPIAAQLPADRPAIVRPSAAPDPWATPASPAEAREPHPAAAPPRMHPAVPTRQPELPAAPLGFHRELKRDANGHLVPIVPYQELRAALPRTDPEMQACLDRSGQSGVRPTGKATLGFTVAAQGGKLVIETTSVQDEDTLGAYPELLECMHRTAFALAPVLDGKPIPELGTPIYVRRHVRVENGALAENSFFNFSYNP